MKFVGLFLIFAVLAAAKCPDVNVISDFNATAYLGVWYEVKNMKNKKLPSFSFSLALFSPFVVPNS
jgi:lipocalin